MIHIYQITEVDHGYGKHQERDRLLHTDEVLKLLRELEGIESVFLLIAMCIYNLLKMSIPLILLIRPNLAEMIQIYQIT